MKVYLSPLAEHKLKKLLIYLEDEWGQSSKTNFLNKLQNKFDQITDHPKSNPLVENFDEIYWCVVTQQSSFFYRIIEKEKEIEILTITDNRQDPEKNLKEIRTQFKT